MNKDIVEFHHKVLLVNVNETASKRSIYDAARFAWRLDKKKVEKIQYVLAVKQGTVVGAFKPLEWKIALNANFPEFKHVDMPGRLGFIGEEAESSIQRLYINKRIPKSFRKKGASNPVRYVL